MMRTALIGLAGLMVAACEAPAPPPATKAPPAPTAPHWAFAIGKNSVEMAWLTDAETAEAPLRLVCARGEGFLVAAPVFRPIGSEERLSVGAGDDAFALVAVAADGPKGPFVKATGPIEEPLLAALESGRPIAASYGAQTFGPVESPPEAMRRAFADTCRKLGGGTQV
ncbi:MAG: hypothetical protein Q8L23_12230 [Caulobacter sp.]|nr:hypothetical protein [Caulobacter sp.]